MSPADQMWWFGLVVGLSSMPMTIWLAHRLVSPEPPRWARDPDVVALVLTGQVVAPVGVLSLAWLAS